MAQHSILIELEGLIKLLAQNLYANPDVFLREMIQNAHDAIIKRKEVASERNDVSIPAPEIRIVIDNANRTLTVIDNGSGLTEAEVHMYIATIGRSGTGELKEKLQKKDRTGTIELIGQFGIGLLSAFIVADSVDLITKSAVEGAYKWSSTGGKYYELESSVREGIGTTLILHIGRDNVRYLNKEFLGKITRRYANFIGVPIYLNADKSPVNEVDAPWHKTYFTELDEHEAHRNYWEKEHRNDLLLESWPLKEEFEYFDEEKKETRKAEVKGILGIVDRNLPGIDTRGTVDLFISRMFITSSQTEILPSWAGFIQGVIECNGLTPNAARDNVIRNTGLNELRKILAKNIFNHLIDLFRSKRDRFNEIIRWHQYQILSMCAIDDYGDFFNEIADYIPFLTNQGNLTISEYAERAEKKGEIAQAFYISEPGTLSQYFLICDASNIIAFDATDTLSKAFLFRYSKKWPNRIELNQLETGTNLIFKPLPENELANYNKIEKELKSISNVSPKVSYFLPKEVPVLLSNTDSARREMEGMVEDVAMPSYIRNKLKAFLGTNSSPVTLHLNADNPIISRLSKSANIDANIFKHALISLYNNAIMLHSKNITPQNIQSMFAQYNQVVDLLLSESEAKESYKYQLKNLQDDGKKTPNSPSQNNTKTKYITCFVAMSFSKPEVQILYRALEEVLEDEPFFWNVIRADEKTVDAQLWKNVEQQMLDATCFIAEVSDHNPNVMIEIGRMEVLQRPLLLIKREGSQDLPADLHGRLHISYNGDGESLIENLRNKILSQEVFCQHTNEKYLSPVLLRKIEGMNERTCQLLSREFKICTELLNASPEIVSQKTGIGKLLIQHAQEELRKILNRN